MIEAILWLVINLYHEARGEPIEAQIAVACATLNRAGWKLENVPDVIQAQKQFSWTSDRRKMAQARQLVREYRIPEEMKGLLKIARKALNTPHYNRTALTHYKAITATSTWGCWPGGVTTTVFPGSGHIFCGDKDVVKPGATPAYIGQRALRRKARAKRELDIGGC